MNKSVERFLAFGFGVSFVVVLLILAIKYPNPTPFQYTVSESYWPSQLAALPP